MGSPFLNDVIDESMWRAICDEKSNVVINNFPSVLFRWRVQKGGNQRKREGEKHCYVRICVKLSAVHNKATDEGKDKNVNGKTEGPGTRGHNHPRT